MLGVLRDSVLYSEHGWVEFSVFPLFSPSGVLAEGLANYAADLVFPMDERIKYEADVLCGLAGVDGADLGLYHRISDQFDKLSWATQVIARDYLDGQMTYEDAIDWHIKYDLSTRERAERAIRFTEQYRSYRVTYRMGEDLCRAYMWRLAGNATDKQWQLLSELYTTPVLPSDLMAD